MNVFVGPAPKSKTKNESSPSVKPGDKMKD